MMFEQIDQQTLKEHHTYAGKQSTAYKDFTKHLRLWILVVVGLFLASTGIALCLGTGFGIALLFGIAISILPAVVGFSLNLNNYRMILGVMGYPTQASLDISGSTLSFTQFRHHVKEQSIVDLTTVKYIVHFMQTNNLYIYGSGQDIYQYEDRKPQTATFNSGKRRWIVIPLVFEHNDNLMTYISEMSGVQVIISDSDDEDLPDNMLEG